MTLVRYLFDAGPEGGLITPANSGATQVVAAPSGTGAVFRGTAAAHGLFGASFTNTPPNAAIADLPLSSQNTQMAFEGVFSIDVKGATITGDVGIGSIRHATGDVLRFNWQQSTSRLFVLDGAGGYILLANNVVANTLYRIGLFLEVGTTSANGKLTANVYSGASSTTVMIPGINRTDVNLGTASPIGVRIGNPGGGTNPPAVTITWDDIQLNDGVTALIGPYQASDQSPLSAFAAMNGSLHPIQIIGARLGAVVPTSNRGPVSYPDLASARASLSAPADANYVMWDPSWPVDRDLEDVFALELSANDILVLPERNEPYVVDSSEGFRAAGVQSVTGRYSELPTINRYKNQRAARTWFAMARTRRGILGLGPNARIVMSDSSWTQEPQVQDKGSVQEDNWVSTGRYWTNTSGVLQSELVGCQEKVIESAHSSPYYGNFTMTTRDLGGVAYSGLSGGSATSTFERLNLTAGWRGFLGIPNGESGAVTVNGGTYLIKECIFGTRDSEGARVGTSPIMINSSTGGHIEATDASETRDGMLTIWRSSGKHTLSNVNCRFNWGPGLNLEMCQAGFELEWTGGSIWSDYYGNGGKTPKPSDQGTKGRLHVGINSPQGSSKVTFRDVNFDNGPTAGAVCIQSYGTTQQLEADIKRYDANGISLPVKMYA